MKKTLPLLALLCISHICWSAAPTVAVSYSGVLVAEPCVIPPGKENIELDFGTVIDKYLYLNQRTPGKEFSLQLTECDLSLGETVSVSFSGTESVALPGLLAINSGGASGIAIGLENTAGELLTLNQPAGKQRLQAGSNIITLRAYVRGEPEAIKNSAIGRGAFSAVATFLLHYD
ncbi:Major MR/P fimbria protein precursor [Serratia entomophila]|uniref:fimbrial protein n=1 Tax=Serratia entomophila TaxID=42906 RepID=UPI002179BB8F|nr:fimbrial protein [Serratia entomophila]CAI0882361.1 Major MR/P fimbria protein precursor [Serratia entomophila]CAI0997568.1 Major MR/P fimbria protein precursor [Serratia entomophila]CAI1130852.1 Major MR/P fimbria protein precursor [Serratia entomophila]CAI1711707.1 Major MR/P fimbria protein precursor [Serratia entomophila]CAI1733090.1 Major MR/P fimbria protein precursor [Serratia entomophila]